MTVDVFQGTLPHVNLLETLQQRGLVQNATPGLAERLAKGPLTAYVGFDPTADSLHVGNLVPVMALAWLQRHGGTPIALVGSGTGMVGDPSGKRSERPVLSVAQIDANAVAIRAQLAHFVSFEGGNAAKLLDNAAWLRPLGLMEFLRETGKHFTVNYMLQKESVKSRMDSGISFTEFSYMLVQAYDFLHLYRSERCELQMGGSDQWGNITAGIELIARSAQGESHGLVCPLLTTTSGGKFGKSEGENVWLDPRRTSPYRFYQFWLNCEDADVERLLKIFTFLPLEEIAREMGAHTAAPEQRNPHRRLAEDLTSRVHGEAMCRRAIAASEILFGRGDLRSADAETLALVAGEVPLNTGKSTGLDGALTLVDALIAAGLASSRADAKRGIEGAGYSVNGERITSDRKVGAADLLAGRYVLLQKGKKNFAMLELVD